MKKYTYAIVSALLAATLLVSVAAALFTNGSFESGDFTGWTQTQFLNPGLTGSAPFTGANIVRNPGGSDQSVVLGPFAALSQTDAMSNNNVAYPAYGSYVARVNGSATGQISNTIYQETIVAAGDEDPVDGLYHVRFVYAAVMEDPGHVPAQQPWFYVVVKNVTKGTTLYEKFSYVGEPGVPWTAGAAGWVYLDWTLVDINPGAGNLDLGDTISLEAIGADCALGGHAGYVYVDEFGPFIPGPTITASGPATTSTGSSITYTYNYVNGAAAVVDLNVSVNAPVGVDFTSSNDVNCAVVAGSATCTFAGTAAGASGSFTITGNVTAAPGATISHGDYQIGATGYPTTGGPVVTTTVDVAPPTLTMTFFSNGDKDGWVRESAPTSGIGGSFFSGAKSANLFEDLAWNIKDATADIIVGDNILDNQYKGFLSFYTAGLPDNATIVKVTLKLRMQQINGTDPYTTHGNLIVDLVDGNYGASGDLEITDFESVTGRNYAAFLGNPNVDWYKAVLRTSAHPFVNLAGLTQFRLHFKIPDNGDLQADYIQFFSGGASFGDRPRLIVEYTIP